MYGDITPQQNGTHLAPACIRPGRLWVLTALLLLFATAASSSDSLRVQTVVLSNGLRVDLIHQPERALVKAELVYDAGACWEPEGQGGLAHLVEHLMFSTRPSDESISYKQLLETHAISSNGWTSSSAMGYQWTCFPEQIEMMLELEQARMHELRVVPGNFEREREVVLQERQYRSGLSVGQQLMQDCFEASFPDHPLGRSPAGSVESVRALTLEDVLRYHASYLRPERASLALVAPIPPEEIIPILERTLATVARPPVDPPTELPPLPLPQHGSAVSDRPENQGFYIGYGIRVPLSSAEDQVLSLMVVDLFDTSIGGMRVRDTDDVRLILVYRWYSRYFAGPEMRRQEVNAENDAQDALSWLWRDMQQASSHWRSPKKFTAAQERVTSMLQGADQASGLDLRGRAMASLAGEQLLGEEEIQATIDGLTPQDCREYLSSMLEPNQVVNVVMHGSGSGRGAGQELESLADLEALDADDVGAPTPSPEVLSDVLQLYQDSGLPRTDCTQLSDGTRLCYWHIPETGEFYLGGWRSFDGLRVLETSERPGLNRLYTHSISYISQEHEEDDERELVELPFDASFYVDSYGFGFQAGGDAKESVKIFSTIIDRLVDPKVDTTAWGRVLRGAPLWYSEDYLSANVKASQYRRSRVFGDDDPSLWNYACPERTLDKVTYKDICRFHEELCSRTGLIWLATGEVYEEALAKALNGKLKKTGLPKTPKALVDPTFTSVSGIEGRVFSDFQESDARLTFSFPACETGDIAELWAERKLVQHLLKKAIYEQLRYRRGLTYAVGATLEVKGDRMCLSVRLSCSPQHFHQTFDQLREVLSGIVDGPLDERTFLTAKLDAAKDLLSAEADAGRALREMQSIAALSPERLADPMAALMAVDQEDLAGTLQRLVDPERFVFTVVGPVLEDEIDGIGF